MGSTVAHGRLLKTDPSLINKSLSRRTRRLAASHIAEGNVSGSWLLVKAASMEDVFQRLADVKGHSWELEAVSVKATEIDSL